MAMAKLPLLKPDRLAPHDGSLLNDPSIYGFSIQSWIDATQHLGPVFELKLGGQNCVVIASTEANKQAWRTPEDWAYRPTDSGTFFRNQMGDDHVSALDAEPHRRLRKLILPAFGAAAMLRGTPDAADHFTTTMDETNGTTTDLFALFCRMYTNALTHTQVKAPVTAALIHKLCEFEEAFINGAQLSLADQDLWFARPEYQKLKAEVFTYFNDTAADRLAGVRAGDSFDLLIQREAPEGMQALTKSELAEAVYLLSVAGVGNIGNILCPLLWAIKDSPWIGRLQREVKGFNVDQFSNMKSFPVTKALISEAERCFAPAPIVPKRTTREVEFLGTRIPAGTLILHLHALAHFDASRYEDPLTFNPQRWLDEQPEKPNAFGGGKHLCLGMGVTRVYLPLTLACLFSQFALELVSPPRAVPISTNFSVSPKTTEMIGAIYRR